MHRAHPSPALPAIAALPLLLACWPAGAQTVPPGSSADRRLGPGAAQPAAPAPASEVPEATLPEVVVQARRAEAARQGILARFGAREYQIDRSTIEALPGGANQPLNQILLQTPGVVQDSFGDIHVRGEHRNLQYRINGVQIPEGVQGFGQVFDTRALRSMSVLTGALPAQFGFRTNAVINLETRTGALDPGGTVGVYGGSFGTIQPFATYAGVVGGWDLFATGTFLRSDRGIENPTSARTVPNNETEQLRGLIYAARQLDPTTRLSVVAGTALNRFQIPAPGGVQSAFTTFGQSEFESANLRSRQWERTWYGTVALQKSINADIDVQIAPFVRYSSIHYVPDLVNELAFNGVASDVLRSSFAGGLQTDAAWRIAHAHTLRAGFLFSAERSRFRSQTALFGVDEDGEALDPPFNLDDRQGRTGYQYGLYVQDEWRVTDRFTVNFGVRADRIEQYTNDGQISPRVNAVWRATDATIFHAGYARTFTPAQQELIATPVLERFVGTTNEPFTLESGLPRPERAHRFDLGVTHRVTPAWTVGADAYYKNVRDLLDFGQFGGALIFTPINYRKGHVYGVEFSTTYRADPVLLYANLALSRSIGKDIRSAQYNFEPEELEYIRGKYVRTDHDQLVTGSAGAVWRAWEGGRLSASMLYGSGLRRGFANSEKVTPYATFNVGAQQDLVLPDGGTWTLRFDILNLFDREYRLRDGTGIGVGAPQFGARRGFFGGVSRAF
jgi:outer membrane receptor protein involved in Fe transport